MPTTLRLLLLLMLGLFGLQPVSYGYDAPVVFVSGAQNIVAARSEIGTAIVETAASVPLNFNRVEQKGVRLYFFTMTRNKTGSGFTLFEPPGQPLAKHMPG